MLGCSGDFVFKALYLLNWILETKLGALRFLVCLLRFGVSGSMEGLWWWWMILCLFPFGFEPGSLYAAQTDLELYVAQASLILTSSLPRPAGITGI